ncbi:hypothetical protein AWP98_05410 [Escherichia coli]|nr:hypothetical protein AWP96_14300 [Escherichia coli]OKX55076.1 hypothetical protein AWP97_07670 [Escherichia coli]OKX70949.1 hypothetical protein AWP98_05410 [Escherichia coli]
MLPSETMIWQPEFTDKTLSRKPGAVQIFSTYVSWIRYAGIASDKKNGHGVTTLPAFFKLKNHFAL